MQNQSEAALISGTAFEFTSTRIDQPEGYKTDTSRLPAWLVYTVLAICGLPFLLNTLGFDFGSQPRPFELSTAAGLSPAHLTDAMFYRLNGAFIHALLEWSAIFIALFTGIMAICHYRFMGNIMTPIIGLALVCAGCVDAFHTLAATRLIDVVAENNNLIPFTWVISQTLYATILTIGVGLLLFTSMSKLKTRSGFLGLVSACFVLLTYLVIHYCATQVQLPRTMYPESLVTRPWDTVPLLLFLFAALYIYPVFYKRQPNIFTHALVISAIPNIVVELHMAFGSTSLFDNHFNIAHFLKIVAYSVPFTGLVLDYIYTHKQLRSAIGTLGKVLERAENTSIELTKSNRHAVNMMAKLKQSNKALEQFAYIASHDLREPLRKITNYTELFAKRYTDKVDEKGKKYMNYVIDGTQRMDNLINDLLLYSRASQSDSTPEQIQMDEVLENVLDNLQTTINQTQARITHDPLPEINGHRTQLVQTLQNLIANAIKFRSDNRPRIHVSAIEHNDDWEFSVRDKGIGFDMQHSSQIFSIFKRLHTRDEYSGTGIGLAICKACVERHCGRIWADSEPGKGATFFFTINKSGCDSTHSEAGIL